VPLREGHLNKMQYDSTNLLWPDTWDHVMSCHDSLTNHVTVGLATFKDGTCVLQPHPEGPNSRSHIHLQKVPIWAPQVSSQYESTNVLQASCCMAGRAAPTVRLHAGTTTALYGWHIASVRPVDPPQPVPAMRRVFSSWFLADESS
jgi:hypothetical protein